MITLNGQPHPSHYPADLVTVIDVYGDRHRVRLAELNNPTRRLLHRYNQYGQRFIETGCLTYLLHRDNITTGKAVQE